MSAWAKTALVVWAAVVLKLAWNVTHLPGDPPPRGFHWGACLVEDGRR